MPERVRLCASEALQEGGVACLFQVQEGEQTWPAFALRHDGLPVAYLNRCSHVPTEMDWLPGRFLDQSQRFIICALHGALYEPQTGCCVSGPCWGKKLTSIPVGEQDGSVYWYPSERFHALN